MVCRTKGEKILLSQLESTDMETSDSLGFIFDLMCLALSEPQQHADLVRETVQAVEPACPVSAQMGWEGDDAE